MKGVGKEGRGGGHEKRQHNVTHKTIQTRPQNPDPRQTKDSKPYLQAPNLSLADPGPTKPEAKRLQETPTQRPKTQPHFRRLRTERHPRPKTENTQDPRRKETPKTQDGNTQDPRRKHPRPKTDTRPRPKTKTGNAMLRRDMGQHKDNVLGEKVFFRREGIQKSNTTVKRGIALPEKRR
jgi:hypothetical protein